MVAHFLALTPQGPSLRPLLIRPSRAAWGAGEGSGSGSPGRLPRALPASAGLAAGPRARPGGPALTLRSGECEPRLDRARAPAGPLWSQEGAVWCPKTGPRAQAPRSTLACCGWHGPAPPGTTPSPPGHMTVTAAPHPSTSEGLQKAGQSLEPSPGCQLHPGQVGESPGHRAARGALPVEPSCQLQLREGAAAGRAGWEPGRCSRLPLPEELPSRLASSLPVGSHASGRVGASLPSAQDGQRATSQKPWASRHRPGTAGLRGGLAFRGADITLWAWGAPCGSRESQVGTWCRRLSHRLLHAQQAGWYRALNDPVPVA